MIENKEHLKKIEKRSLRIKFPKTIIALDLIEFFDLMPSLHMPDHKPNYKRHKAAPKSIGKT